MLKRLTLNVFALICCMSTLAHAASPQVRLDTSEGTIVVELFAEKAPRSVANFLRYVDAGFYDQTIFHRVIAGFMVQGGGYAENFRRKDTLEPVENEANNGLSNERGTLAMARTADPHSATAQFFINHADNPYLDHRSETMRGWGYTVFGKVVEGMEVVDAIAGLPTGPKGPFRSDVPEPLVLINKAERVSAGQGEAEGEDGADQLAPE